MQSWTTICIYNNTEYFLSKNQSKVANVAVAQTQSYENICKRLILGKKPKSRLKIHNPMLTMYLFAVPRAAWCRPPPAPRWPGWSSSCRRSAGRPAGSSGPGRRTTMVGITCYCLLTGGHCDLSVAGENVHTFLF